MSTKLLNISLTSRNRNSKGRCK